MSTDRTTKVNHSVSLVGLALSFVMVATADSLSGLRSDLASMWSLNSGSEIVHRLMIANVTMMLIAAALLSVSAAGWSLVQRNSPSA